jgi:hypothetical protein
MMLRIFPLAASLSRCRVVGHAAIEEHRAALDPVSA